MRICLRPLKIRLLSSFRTGSLDGARYSLEASTACAVFRKSSKTHRIRTRAQSMPCLGMGRPLPRTEMASAFRPGQPERTSESSRQTARHGERLDRRHVASAELRGPTPSTRSARALAAFLRAPGTNRRAIRPARQRTADGVSPESHGTSEPRSSKKWRCADVGKSADLSWSKRSLAPMVDGTVATVTHRRCHRSDAGGRGSAPDQCRRW